MTKLEAFTAARATAIRVFDMYLRATGQDSPQNDKARIECRWTGKLSTEQFQPAILTFHASHGYYGSSGCASDMNADMARYVAKAITERGKDIMRRAAEMAKQDAEVARKAAEDEARSVLEAVLSE